MDSFVGASEDFVRGRQALLDLEKPRAAQGAHAFIRSVLTKMFDKAAARKIRIQYGGSVKPANAHELMSQPDVDGALVGGAALEARSFADIIKNSI